MKKKLLRWATPFKIAVLFCAISSVFSSCDEKIQSVDRSFEVSGKTTTHGNIYVNAEIPLEIQMYADVMKKEDADIVFVSSDIKGTLFNSSKNEIKTDAPFKHKFEQPLYLIFKPSEAKELGTLKFKINGQDLSIELQINNPSHGILFAKEVDTITLGKQLQMQFSVIENKETIAAMASKATKAGGNTYTLSASMLEGKGILMAKEKTLINNTAQLSSPMGSAPAPVSKANEDEIALTKEELINAVFIPFQEGENTIQFKITDSYGNTVNQTRTMQAAYDSMSLTFVSTRDVAEVGQTLLYDMTLAMDGYTGNFRFHPTLISGAGVLKVDGAAVSLVTPFTVAKPGTKRLIFEPSGKSGNVAIAFQVFDDFGGFVRDTLRGTIEDNSFKVTTTLSPDASVRYTESVPLVVGISQDAQSAQYTYIVKSNVDGVVLKKENAIIAFGPSMVISSGLHNFTFTGAACGDVVLTFEVKHATQEKTVKLDIPIKVSAYPLSVNLLNQSATTTRLNVPVTFDLQFETEKALADNTYFITPSVKGLLGVLGTFGSSIPPPENGVYKTTKGTHQFTYTPMGLGEHTVEFEVYDGPAFGQRKTVSALVKVVHAEIVVTPSTTTLNTHINENKGFTINVSEEDYTGGFKLSYTGGTGDLKTSMGQTIVAGTPTAITKGTTILSYTPKAIGTETLKFIVTDENNQSKEFAIVVTSTHVPMTFSASIAGNEFYIGQSYPISLNFSGAGPYKVSYTGGSGTVERNGQPIASGTTVSVSSNEQWHFKPVVGTATLNFIAQDKNGQSKESSINVTATHVPMTFTASIAGSGYNGRSYSVPLSFSGAGPYKVSYTMSGSGVVKRNNQPVVQGATVSVSNSENWTFEPVGNSTLSFTAIDKNGQSKSASATIQSRAAAVSASMSSPTSSVVKKNNVTSSLRVSNEAGDNTYRLDVSGSYNGTLNITSGTNYTTSSGQIGLTFNPNTLGSHTITIKATDNFGQSATTTWTVNAVAAEINASMSGGAANYLGFAQSVTVNVSKPDYSSGYTVNLSSNNSGTFSQTTINIAGGGGSPSFTYTPTAVGNHTLTATITDLDKKSKTVSVVVVGNAPNAQPLATYDGQKFIEGMTMAQMFKTSPAGYPDVTITYDAAQYPAGSTFSIPSGHVYTGNVVTWNTTGNSTTGTVTGSWSVTDRWGQTFTTHVTGYHWSPTGKP